MFAQIIFQPAPARRFVSEGSIELGLKGRIQDGFEFRAGNMPQGDEMTTEDEWLGGIRLQGQYMRFFIQGSYPGQRIR